MSARILAVSPAKDDAIARLLVQLESDVDMIVLSEPQAALSAVTAVAIPPETI